MQRTKEGDEEKSRLSEKVEEIHFILSVFLFSRLSAVSGTEPKHGKQRDKEERKKKRDSAV